MNIVLYFLTLLFISSPLSYLSAEDPSSRIKVIDLSKHEGKRYSQNGEDGVIRKIFQFIGADSYYYVEFGTQNGDESNTRLLRAQGWHGLLMDGSYENSKINLHKEFITKENINSLFKKYDVPYELDLLSIDIDYNDFYVWHAIENVYKPRLVIIEYNSTHFPNEDKVVAYAPNAMWDGTNYFGASILALYNLGKLKGYSLVYADAKGVNLFFIRNDLLENLQASGWVFKNTNDVNAIYRRPRYGQGPNGGHRQDPHGRKYLTSKEIL